MKRFALHAIALAVVAIVIGWHSPSKADEPGAADVQKWVVDRMVAWSKPGVTLHPPAMESFEDGQARYALIADAVLTTVAREKPLFGGSRGRLRTAALLLSISMFESSYRKDVDMNLGKEGRGDGGRSWCLMQVQLGAPIYIDATTRKRVQLIQVCKDAPLSDVKPGAQGTYKKCEFVPPANSIQSTPSRVVLTKDGYELTSDQTRGYNGQDLIADRGLCFTVGLRILRNSFHACSALPMLERLSAYASGNCADGREASRRRMTAAVRWMSSYPPPADDAQLVRLFTPAVPVPPAPNSLPSAVLDVSYTGT